MRILALAILLALAAPATAETRSFGVSGFDRIKVQGPFWVTVKTGVAPSAKAVGSGAALANIDVRVDGNLLTVSPNASTWSSYSGDKAGPVEIQIGTHELAAATMLGAGSMTIDRVKAFEFLLTVNGAGSASIANAKVDRLKLGVAGTGQVRAAGEAKDLDVVMKGSASLRVAELKAKDATLAVQGGASAELNVTNTATVTGAGSGLVAFTGNPSCILKVQGAGTVTGCR